MNHWPRAGFVVLLFVLGRSSAAQLPLEAGNVVATYCPVMTGPGSPDPSGPSVILVTVNGGGPLGTNWLAPLFSNEGAASSEVWNYQNLGSVFGLALDGQSNVYVTASSTYGDFGAATYGPGGGGAVYRLDGHTGAIDSWMTTGSGAVGTSTLPNPAVAGVTPPGLGDICHDSVFDQFFISDFADGRIYQVKDVGGQGIVQAVYDPFVPFPYPGSPNFAPLGERVWAVHVATVPVVVSRVTLAMKRVLLFSVWLRDTVRAATAWPSLWPIILQGQANNAIFAWELDGLGNLVSAGPRLYCVMPHLDPAGGLGYSNPVSDITSSFGAIYFAERSIRADYGQVGFGHQARILRLRPLWNKVTIAGPLSLASGSLSLSLPDPFDYRYRIGDWAQPRGWNCAGGVAVGPQSVFAGGRPPVWSTGDALGGFSAGNYIYGLQRIPGQGNVSCTPYSSCTNLIDLDHDILVADKARPGDVEFIARNAP